MLQFVEVQASSGPQILSSKGDDVAVSPEELLATNLCIRRELA